MIPIVKIVYYSQFQEEGACHPIRRVKYWWWSGSRRREDCRFPRKRMGEAGRTGLAYLNSFKGLWDIGPTPSCLISGSGMIRPDRLWLGMWEPNKGGVWGVGSGLGLVFENCIHRQVVYYLQELANPARGRTSRISQAPDVRASQFRNRTHG